MVAIADVLAQAVLDASKEPEPHITAGDFAEMVTAAARTLHHALTNADLRSIRNSAMATLALHLVVEHQARTHRTQWDTVGAWLAGVSGEEARAAIAAAGISLRTGASR